MNAELVDVRLRPFAEADYARMVAIVNANYPDYPQTVEEIRHWDRSWETDRYDRLRLVAENEAGGVVGAGEIHHLRREFHPQKYAMQVHVDPAWQRRGIGSAIYERLLAELRARAAIAVRTSVQESLVDTIDFLHHRGFVEILRMWESRLDVDSFDFGRFAGAEERVTRAGIVLTDLATEGRLNPNALRQAYELFSTVYHDVPSHDPITDTSFESFVAHTANSPTSILDAFFLAKSLAERRGARYVGLSNLHRSLAESDVLYQGLTGTLREYRGHGIALALKLRTVRYARDHGIPEIRTWNDARNRPMLRVNEALGFVKQPVWIDFQKALA